MPIIQKKTGFDINEKKSPAKQTQTILDAKNK